MENVMDIVVMLFIVMLKDVTMTGFYKLTVPHIRTANSAEDGPCMDSCGDCMPGLVCTNGIYLCSDSDCWFCHPPSYATP